MVGSTGLEEGTFVEEGDEWLFAFPVEADVFVAHEMGRGGG